MNRDDTDKIVTLEEVRAQIREREAELARLHGDVDPTHVVGRVQARDEALERMCVALQYLQNSLGEVQATRARLDLERGTILRELRDTRARAETLDAELRSVRLAHREVDRQMETHEPDDPDAAPPGAR
jgi:chromosome segregation ATPase